MGVCVAAVAPTVLALTTPAPFAAFAAGFAIFAGLAVLAMHGQWQARIATFFSVLLGVTITLVLVAMRARLASFRAQAPQDMAAMGPTFDLKSHLDGPILCEGMIYGPTGPTGRVVSRFVADMEGRWDGNVGTLSEVFRYDSGTTQHRCWTLALQPDGGIKATAPDVAGAGTGAAKATGVSLRYRIRPTPEAGDHVLDVADWMVLMENGTIMNRSQFSKFGITVAEPVATMRKVPA